ncbi:MAG TPA: dTMP kinase [Candidatus Hydrogenedentes bacterium]|nr:dTMP kinase [Candidatus Hydrogenedentota bacterium]HIJ73453.1 dTMP kinase [Candidatus Hydrogenedentota bacterium]
MAGLHEPHEHPGMLIVVEGIDGSGKSTQLDLVRSWLIQEGYNVFFTEWNSSKLVKRTTKLGKTKQILTPTTFSLIHCTDFSDRLEQSIVPYLQAGMVVLADRYVYTAFCRDVVRGVERQWVRDLYSFAVRPDIAFYFSVPLEVAMRRIFRGRPMLKYYEAGMDLNLSRDPAESFMRFQRRIIEEYERVVKEHDLVVVNGAHPIERQQRRIRRFVTEKLQEKKMSRGKKKK